jgi:4-hydroxy-3-methylbut-2-enyl diphosphate reductase
VRDGEPLPDPFPNRVAIISQTTQTPERFAQFVAQVMAEHVNDITELRLINTLCNVTSNQQAAARELAQEVDVMIVVGGRASANTRHLVEVVQDEGTTAHHIETADEIEPGWLDGCERVGVTAGASTPDSAVEAVVERIRGLAGADPHP